MRIAVYPGSFDPLTAGHMDVIARAAKLFDELHVTVLENPAKRCAFSIEERREMIAEAAAAEGIENVIADSFEGLTTDWARRVGACAMIRGIRDGEDAAYELRLAAANRRLCDAIETVLLPARPELSYISSSAVREIASHGRDIDGLVPEAIKNKIAERLIER